MEIKSEHETPYAPTVKGNLRRWSGISSWFAVILIYFLLCGRTYANTGIIKEPSYSFDPTKLVAAESPLQFMRSYVDYFYLLLSNNTKNLSTLSALQSTSGWCVGDAHPENFGFLVQDDGSSIFSMNDLDDGGPCPVGLDLLRLLVSGKLALKGISVETLRAAYLMGLRGDSFPVPLVIGELKKKSQKKGKQNSSKKISGNKIVRDNDMNEVSVEEKQSIDTAMASLGHLFAPRAQLLDVVSRRKVGGGSGGLLRYEILVQKGTEKIHLELKEQILPAIASVVIGKVPDISERVAKGVQYTQSPFPSRYYVGLKVGGRDMLMRPLFSGNMGLEITDFNQENAHSVVYFQTYSLGTIHARSISDKKVWIEKFEEISLNSLFKDVMVLSEFFEDKFKAMKPQEL